MLFSREGNIPTKGEQHACYMAEHLTIDLLYHYHADNMYTCNITVKGELVSAHCTRFSGPFIMEFIGILSQHMLLRHGNMKIEAQLPQNWRIVALGSLYSF